MRRSRDKASLEPPQARDAALRLLGRREHSARELKSKLLARGLEGEAADEIVGNLSESGWQSDARYAEMLVRSRLAQGYGPLRIEAEMRQAGIDGEAIRQALDGAGEDWDAVLHRAWERRFGTPAGNLAERQKQYRYLMGRGFSPSAISRLLKHDDE